MNNLMIKFEVNSIKLLIIYFNKKDELLKLK